MTLQRETNRTKNILCVTAETEQNLLRETAKTEKNLIHETTEAQ